MNTLEAILNAGNRILEEPCVYRRRDGGETLTFPVSIESRDVVQFAEAGAEQSFRFTVFSCDAGAFGGGENGPDRPQRGDTLNYRGAGYKVVEFEGVTWKPRFDPFDGRILFFAERA